MKSTTYPVLIQPQRSWWRLDLRELWEYRDMLLLLVHRDWVARYRQTILGPVWAVVQPVLTTIVFTVIFSRVAQIPTEGAPPVLFYLAGLLGWNYFALTFQHTSNTFVGNAPIFGKVYFPRLVIPLACSVSNLITFGIQLLTFFGFYGYFWISGAGGFHVSGSVLLLPFLLIQVGLLALGCGLWMSALTAKYRDLQQVAAFLLQLWLYATPVIYPLSVIPERWPVLAMVNPMAMPVEICRKMLLGTGTVPFGYWLFSAAVAAVIFLSGAMVFHRVERTFVDTA